MARTTRRLPIALAAAVLFAVGPILGASSAQAEATLRLESPVDCRLGEDCWVQFYVDRDPGPESLDYACGSLSYDGHKGTDIRLPDLVAMREGVAVLAAADGRVRAVRDEMADISLDEIGAEAVRGLEAGNAVVLTHPGGWETQYSHLREGSVAVRPGEEVSAGQLLGLIGLSGEVNYPHLHFEVRLGHATVDPFVGPAGGTGCDVFREPLWTPEALEALAYTPSAVLGAGFAGTVPHKAAARNGAYRQEVLMTTVSTLVFWTDVFGVKAGDEEVFRIYAPDGGILVEQRHRLETDGHQRFNYAGMGLTGPQWPAGTYRGEYELLRAVDGAMSPVLSARREVTLR